MKDEKQTENSRIKSYWTKHKRNVYAFGLGVGTVMIGNLVFRKMGNKNEIRIPKTDNINNISKPDESVDIHDMDGAFIVRDVNTSLVDVLHQLEALVKNEE